MRINADLSRGRSETLTFLDAIAANMNSGSFDALFPLIAPNYVSGRVMPAYALARSLTVSGGDAQVERVTGLCPRIALGSSGATHLAGEDDAGYSSAGAAFSLGIWVNQPVAAVVDLISKYDTAGAADREWRLSLDADGDIDFELFDESVPASEIANAATAYTAGEWHSIICTYDGTSADPLMHIYLDGIQQTDGTSTETGVFVAMEAGATPVLIGASGTTAIPLNTLVGEIALPFFTDIELTAPQAVDIYINSGILLGMFEGV